MRPSTADLQGPCQKTPEATDIRLRILPAPIQNKFQDTVFGFTVQPVLASVYYEYAVRLAKSDDAEFEAPIILGCVIAHDRSFVAWPEQPLRRGNHAAAMGTQAGRPGNDGHFAFHARTVEAHASPGANANRAAEALIHWG